MYNKKKVDMNKYAGLRRSGKSCRLRWMNYLRPNLKHGHITAEEANLIVELHKQWGNRYTSFLYVTETF